ncbi:hypothetical protein D3C72_674570 [compost metagenome]
MRTEINRLGAEGTAAVVKAFSGPGCEFVGTDLRAGGGEIACAAVEQHPFALGLAAADIHTLTCDADIAACQRLAVGVQLTVAAQG